MNTTQQNTGNTRANMGAFSTEGALKVRLDVSNLLLNIERDLRGEIITIYEDADGAIKTAREQIGEKKANDAGIQAILKFLRSSINTPSIQGNLDLEQYDNFISDKRSELTKRLFINYHKFDVSEEDFDEIIDDCLSTIELVISRPLDNLERESYAQTIKHTETATLEQKKGLLPV